MGDGTRGRGLGNREAMGEMERVGGAEGGGDGGGWVVMGEGMEGGYVAERGWGEREREREERRSGLQ